jgi:hypothetical protein
MKSDYLFISRGIKPGVTGREVKRELRRAGRNGPKMGIVDKGLLLNVGCSNQGLSLLAGGCRQKAAI